MEARETAVHCEAKKHGYRQTQDGVVVSFVIHPNDVPDALALFPLGTRVMLAVAEVGDDEQPVAASKPGKSFAKREAYQMMDDMEQARVRAVMMCKAPDYQRWRGVLGEYTAINDMRLALDIKSRSEIASSEDAFKKFLAHETSFKQWAGQVAEKRG